MSEQLALFDLPPGTVNEDERPEDMPESMRKLLESGVSGRTIALLLERLPGCVVNVPLRPNEQHILTRAIGLDAARDLSAIAGGDLLPVPRCSRMRRRIRNEKIKMDVDRGVEIHQIAIEHGITERTVWGVLGKD